MKKSKQCKHTTYLDKLYTLTAKSHGEWRTIIKMTVVYGPTKPKKIPHG
jgi:hypothetical protein